MASNEDFVQFIVDQCSGAGDITAKKMMGDYCIYCDGTLFGLICDNNLFIKPTYQGAAQLRNVVMRSPYPGAKEHFYIDDVDDRDYLSAIIRATLPALPKSKSRRNPMLKKEKTVPVSLDDTIPPRIVCSQELRTFFEQYLGKGFRYKVGFQLWLRENPGKTYRDAIKAYKTY
jgi:TfoX/Sxy family transcriptional regulator of competence genes